MDQMLITDKSENISCGNKSILQDHHEYPTITEFYQPADAVCCGRTTGLWVYLPSLESGLFAFCRLVQCMA